MGYTKCGSCGRTVPDARKCSGCGASLHEKAVPTARSTSPAAGRRIPLGPLVVVNALLLAGIAYVSGWLPPWGSPPPPPAPTPLPTRVEDRRFGLDEAKRREVFTEILRAEDWAQLESDRRYPPLDPSAGSDAWARHGESRELFRRQAVAESWAAIAKRYALTVEQLRAIAAEGNERFWPRPERRSLR